MTDLISHKIKVLKQEIAQNSLPEKIIRQPKNAAS